MLCFRWTFTHCRCLSHSLSHLSVCSSVFRTRHPALTEHSQNHQTTRVASVCKHKCTGREKNWKRKVWLSSSWMDYPLQSLWPSVSPCRMVWSQAWTTFGFFYTGLPDHRRNSYLSLELIMPSLPPPRPYSSWCGKVSFPHIARCSKKDYDFAGMCVRVCVRASNQWDCKRWRERTWNWLNCRGKIMEGNFPKAFTFESKCLMT